MSSVMGSDKRAKKITQRQLEVMTDFIMRHKSMVVSKFSSKFTAMDKEKLWDELTEILNSDGLGPKKDSKKWKRTWINIKSETKGKLAEIKKHQKGTGGGAAIDGLPPLMEKISSLIDPIMVVGDEDIIETGLQNETSSMVLNEEEEEAEGIDSVKESCQDNVDPAASSKELLVSTPCSTKSRHRKVNGKGFHDLVEIEKDKVEALKNISIQLSRANELKEIKLQLYQERTATFVNIANGFLDVINKKS